MEIFNYINNLKKSNNTWKDTSHKQVFLLSGQSNYKNSHLCPKQIALLKIFNEKSYVFCPIGFPFKEEFSKGIYYEPHVIIASIRNIKQYLLLLFSKRYKNLVKKHLRDIIHNDKKQVFITQSQGLRMLMLLDKDILKDIRVIALGPVTLSKYRYNITVIKGKKDYISRVFDFNKADYIPNCGHMDYLEDENIKKIIKTIID